MEKTIHVVHFISDSQLERYIAAAKRNGYVLKTCDGNEARLESDTDITILKRW